MSFVFLGDAGRLELFPTGSNPHRVAHGTVHAYGRPQLNKTEEKVGCLCYAWAETAS